MILTRNTLLLPLLCLSLVYGSSVKFFDSCPSRRPSIGACLAGLCPAGSECINGYCCKLKESSTTTTTTTVTSVGVEEMSIEENEEYGKCSNGRSAIGECISNSCPTRYQCEKGKCCKIPDGAETTKISPNVTEGASKSVETTIIPEAEKEEIKEVKEKPEKETEIESIKKTVKKKIIEVEYGSNEVEATTKKDDDYEIDVNSIGEREEIDDITTTEKATTTTEAMTTRRKKTRRPAILTTTTTEATTTTIKEDEIDTGCPVGEPIGECISNQCPEGHACFHDACCILTPQINCTDSLGGCAKHLCNKRGYKEFMTKNCARTCAKCHMIDIDTSEVRVCRDRRSDCEEWAKEGFCESSLYTTRQKLKFCGKSCKLC